MSLLPQCRLHLPQVISTVDIFLPGEPIGKGRPRFAMGRTYTPPATVAYEYALKTEAALAMRQTGLEPFEGPVAVKVVAYFSIPKSWSKTRRAGAYLHTTKPDLDNVLKMLDALNGVVWLDDAQVCEATVSKRYTTDEPGLQITVTA